MFKQHSVLHYTSREIHSYIRFSKGIILTHDILQDKMLVTSVQIGGQPQGGHVYRQRLLCVCEAYIL